MKRPSSAPKELNRRGLGGSRGEDTDTGISDHGPNDRLLLLAPVQEPQDTVSRE